jgi:hypothetical protein
MVETVRKIKAGKKLVKIPRLLNREILQEVLPRITELLVKLV